MKMFRAGGLLAGIILALASAPASADVILNFQQTGGSPAGGVTLGGTLTVTDQAYADGLNLSYSLSAGGAVSTANAGLVDASFFFSTPGLGTVSLTLADLLAGSGLPAGTSVLGSLTSSPGDTPSGFLNASGTGFVFQSSTDGNLFSGNFTAALGACIGNGCSFNGTVVTTVPEPSALSLMALGGAALLVATRRRKPAAAQPALA
jgi:hypothetical protein